jgi:hypothetical protein
MNSPLPDLGGEQWTEPVPPEPHRLMTNVDTTPRQQFSTWRSYKEYRTYIITVRRIISGDELK